MALDVLERSARDAFAERRLQIVNGEAPAVTASASDRTGLFDTMAGLPPASSRTITGAANLLYTIYCLHRMSAALAAGRPGLVATWGREQALQLLGAGLVPRGHGRDAAARPDRLLQHRWQGTVGIGS